jgi:hypothetical protein
MTASPTLEQVRDAAARLREQPPVMYAAVTESDPRRGGDPTLEVGLVDGTDRLPPDACRVLAAHDCGIADVTPQGSFTVALAV